MLNRGFPGLVLQEILGGLTFNPALPEIFSHGSYIDLFWTNISVKGHILNNFIMNLLFLFQVRTKNSFHNSSRKLNCWTIQSTADLEPRNQLKPTLVFSSNISFKRYIFFFEEKIWLNKRKKEKKLGDETNLF